MGEPVYLQSESYLQQPNTLFYVCSVNQKSFSPLDLEQPPCVEATERLLTSYMLQVVSSLTLRSIKNTGKKCIHKYTTQSLLFLLLFLNMYNLLLDAESLHLCSSRGSRPWYGSLHQDLLG